MKCPATKDIVYRTVNTILTATLLAWLLFSPGVVLAVDDADLFDELEKGINEQKTGEHDPGNTSFVKEKWPHAWVKTFGDNLEGSLRLRYHYFLDTPDETDGAGDSSVKEALFTFSTWSGEDKVKIHASGWAETGTRDNTYQGITHWFQDTDYYRRYVEINELYAFFSLDNADIILGKKLFNTGICTLVSPSDRFRPMDLHDPLDPRQFGIWQIKANYYLDDDMFEFAIMPVYTHNKPPDLGSRWWGDSPIELVSDAVIEDRPDVSWKNVDYFAKFKTTQSGWDFFLSTNSGPSPYSVVKKQGGELYEEIIRITTVAGGFSTTLGDVEIHGEAIYTISHKNRDDDYVSTMAGFTYNLNDYAGTIFMENIVLTVEYAREFIVDRQSADTYFKSSEDGRLGVNDLVSRIQLNYDKDLKCEHLFHYEISDDAWMNRFELSYRIMPGLTCAGVIEIFEGKDDGSQEGDSSNFDTISYAQWDNNDRVIVYVEYEF